MQSLEIVDGLTEFQGQSEVLFQVRGNEALKGNRKTILTNHVSTGLTANDVP